MSNKKIDFKEFTIESLKAFAIKNKIPNKIIADSLYLIGYSIKRERLRFMMFNRIFILSSFVTDFNPEDYKKSTLIYADMKENLITVSGTGDVKFIVKIVKPIERYCVVTPLVKKR